MIEVLKQMIEVLKYIDEGANNQGAHTGISWRDVSNKAQPAIQAGKQAIAELESQEPVAWRTCVEGIWFTAGKKAVLHKELVSINSNAEIEPLYTHPPQRTEQEPVDYEKLAALGWQAIKCGICGGGAMGYPQRTEQNFCPRCGKRTKDLTYIHTCTPPQD